MADRPVRRTVVDERELLNATRPGVTAGERAQPGNAVPTDDLCDLSVEERERNVFDSGPPTTAGRVSRTCPLTRAGSGLV